MPFNVYARQLKTGTKFYVRFRDLDTGELAVAQSVDKVRERINKNDYSPICKKNMAEMYCYKALELRVAFKSNSEHRGNTITLEEYILSFWDYDNC